MAKEQKKFRIIRDSREKKDNGWDFRASANCLGMEVKKLDVGDYSIEGYEHLIMIERKSIADLWHTLVQDRERFIRQMERARPVCAKYIIIEGTLKDVMDGIYWSKVRPEFILSSITSLEVKYGVHVVFTSKRTDVSQAYVRRLLAKLFQYCEEGIISGRPVDTQ